MKKKLIAPISFLCYIICWVQAADEHYYVKNLSIQDGLSQTTVNAIIQDKKGFMWFGTKGGVQPPPHQGERTVCHQPAH